MKHIDKDMIGQKFGRLTVISRGENYIIPSTGQITRRWNCLCDCGVYKNNIRESSLKSGNTQSCGCVRNEKVAESNKKMNRKTNRYEFKDEYVIGYDLNNNPFFFDKDDYEKVKDLCWHFDNKGYVVSSISKKANIKMHRLIMGEPTDLFVDHMNGCKNDNRKDNLRICTPSQNAMNHIHKNPYGISGIYPSKYNTWYATISKNRKNYFLGSFSSQEEAVKARKVAEENLFGEFSYYNSRGIDYVE